MSCHVRGGPAIEKAEMPARGVIDGKSDLSCGNPRRPGTLNELEHAEVDSPCPKMWQNINQIVEAR
jgi:hypothetical protein